MSKHIKVTTFLGLVIMVVAGLAVINLKSDQKNKLVEPIRIGAILPLTGPASGVGNTHRESIEWVIQKLQTSGVPVEVVFEDSQTDPKKAVEAFNNLVAVKDVNIILTTLSSVTLALKPLAEEKRVLVISDATHPRLLDDSQFTLRHSFTVDRDAQVIADHISKQKYQKIGLLYQQDDWGKAYHDEFIKIASKKGFSLSSEQINNRESDFKTSINKIMNQRPDALVFVALGHAGGLLVKQARELGYRGALYSSPGFIATPDAITIAGTSAQGMYYSTFSVNEQFVKDFRDQFHQEPAVIGSWKYTDVELLLHAINQTKSRDPGVLVGFIKGMKEFQGTYERVEISPEGNIIVPTHIETWNK